MTLSFVHFLFIHSFCCLNRPRFASLDSWPFFFVFHSCGRLLYFVFSSLAFRLIKGKSMKNKRLQVSNSWEMNETFHSFILGEHSAQTTRVQSEQSNWIAIKPKMNEIPRGRSKKKNVICGLNSWEFPLLGPPNIMIIVIMALLLIASYWKSKAGSVEHKGGVACRLNSAT